MQDVFVFVFFFYQLTGQQGKGGDHLLFHSATSTSCLMSLFVVLIIKNSKSKSNDWRIFAKSRQTRWIPFFYLVLEQTFFFKICFHEVAQISFFILGIPLQRKTLCQFLIPPLRKFYKPAINFIALESFFLQLAFRKEFANAFFICHFRDARWYYQLNFKVCRLNL